jgi:signal transduction histidine kinase
LEAAHDVLGWLQFGSWTLLAIVALRVWHGHRDESASWLALTFGSLAVVVIVAQLIPENVAEHPPAALVKPLLAGLMLFPYLLYRFVFSFTAGARWERKLVGGLTLAVCAATFALPRIPRPDEPRPWWLLAYSGLFFVQWGFSMGRVSTHLWRQRKGQPAIARRRMATMSAGALGLIGSLIIAVFFPAHSTEAGFPQVLSASISLATGPFFLLGFAPPRIVRLLWRQQAEKELRETEIGLAASLSRTEIVERFVPRIVELLGGRGAAILDESRALVGQHGNCGWEEAAVVAATLADAPMYEPVTVSDRVVLRMENGWLVVTVGPYTPFFGSDELQMLSASAVVADLAIGRAAMFERERQAREAMGDFVAIASHDLRTPVTVIHGFTELLSAEWRHIPDEQRREYVQAVERQVVHLDRLIGELLTVSKLDVGEVDVFPESVDMNEAVREAVATVANGTMIPIEQNSRAWVYADPEHVTRIVQNYVSNAVTYGAEPIDITITVEDADVVVRVRDHGAGVPESFVPRLFEKFARVEKKKSKAARGTGLGLSIVRGLARANGGDAWYEPNAPDGACFAFRLPLERMRVHGEAVSA